MKKYYLVLAVLCLLQISCQKNLLTVATSSCSGGVLINDSHPMKDSINAIIKKYISKGMPGIQVAVKNNAGWFVASGGFANIEKKSLLESCSTNWLFSITKIYTASLIMLEKEKGRISLDLKINSYLPAEVANHIKGSDKITVRMLLNHTSGIVNFTRLPEYQLSQFNNPIHQPSMSDEIKIVYGKSLLFEPGTDYSYSNTNYLLLHMILEQITGKTYKDLLQNEVLYPLALTHTYYGLGKAELNSLNFPDYYFDRYANDQLENISLWNQNIGMASYGYGGIASNASDVILFFEALINGKLVSEASLKEMRTWITGKSSDQPDYGLGIEYYQFAPGTTPQYGHEGDGIANSTMILYVPDNQTYLFINCTAGRQLYSPYLFKITDLERELSTYVSKWR